MSRSATYQEFQELKSWMVVHFAAKEDLSRFATKEDLRNEITQVQNWVICNFATKEDLNRLENRMLAGFDKTFGWLEKLEQEQVFTHHALERHDKQFDSIHHTLERHDKQFASINQAISSINQKLDKLLKKLL